MMKNTTKILLYGCYSLAALIFFLYYLFPSDTVRDMLLRQFARVHPQVHISTEHVKPTFPPGLKLEPLTVEFDKSPVASSNYLIVKPDLLSLLGDRKSLNFNGPMGAGEYNGRADLTMDPKRPQSTLLFNLKTVPLEALEILARWPLFKATGDLNAYVDYDSRKGAGGTAKINLDITPVRIVFQQPVAGLERLDFSQLQAEIAATPRMLQISRCEASGTQLEAKISGSIIFRQPIESSRVTLSCTLKPQPAFAAEHKNDMLGGLLASSTAQKRGIVLLISGTLDNPKYVMR
jgi:type II secretion system protein N